MAFKVQTVLFITAFLFVVLMYQSEAFTVKREAVGSGQTTSQTTSQTIDELLAKIQTEFQDIAKKVQDNELLQNIQKSVKQTSDAVIQKTNEAIANLNKKN